MKDEGGVERIRAETSDDVVLRMAVSHLEDIGTGRSHASEADMDRAFDAVQRRISAAEDLLHRKAAEEGEIDLTGIPDITAALAVGLRWSEELRRDRHRQLAGPVVSFFFSNNPNGHPRLR